MSVDVWLMGFDNGAERAVPGLMEVFGIDEARATALVQQLPRIVKRNAAPQMAEQYAAALRSIGGTVEVRGALSAADVSERIPVPNVTFSTPSVSAPSNSTVAAPQAAPLGSAPLPDGADAPTGREDAMEIESHRYESAPLGAPLVPASPSDRVPGAAFEPTADPRAMLDLGEPIAPTIAADDVPRFDAGSDDGPGPTVAARPSAQADAPLETARDIEAVDYDDDLVRGVPTARAPAGNFQPATTAQPLRPQPSQRPAPARVEPAAADASTGWVVFAVLMLVGLGSGAYGLGRTTVVDEQLTAGAVEEPVLRASDLGMTIEVDECFRAPTCVPINDIFDKADFHAFIEELYNAGTPQVMFANLTKDNGALRSSWLVVEMPGDIGSRTAVLAVFNEWMGTEVRDIGQPYIDADLAAPY